MNQEDIKELSNDDIGQQFLYVSNGYFDVILVGYNSITKTAQIEFADGNRIVVPYLYLKKRTK